MTDQFKTNVNIIGLGRTHSLRLRASLKTSRLHNPTIMYLHPPSRELHTNWYIYRNAQTDLGLTRTGPSGSEGRLQRPIR